MKTTLAISSLLLGISAAFAQTAPKMATEIPPGIAIPDEVETRLGTLRFFDGFPDKPTVGKIYDNLDFQRAVQAYLLGAWLRSRPVLVDVILRTLLYGVGTLLVMLLEKAFESRHEQGVFGSALMNVFQHRDMPHVWANAICVSGALLFYNLLSSLNRHLRTGGLARVFLSPPRQDARTP